MLFYLKIIIPLYFVIFFAIADIGRGDERFVTFQREITNLILCANRSYTHITCTGNPIPTNQLEGTIVNKLTEYSQSGDPVAREFVGKYLAGQPIRLNARQLYQGQDEVRSNDIEVIDRFMRINYLSSRQKENIQSGLVRSLPYNQYKDTFRDSYLDLPVSVRTSIEDVFIENGNTEGIQMAIGNRIERGQTVRAKQLVSHASTELSHSQVITLLERTLEIYGDEEEDTTIAPLIGSLLEKVNYQGPSNIVANAINYRLRLGSSLAQEDFNWLETHFHEVTDQNIIREYLSAIKTARREQGRLVNIVFQNPNVDHISWVLEEYENFGPNERQALLIGIKQKIVDRPQQITSSAINKLISFYELPETSDSLKIHIVEALQETGEASFVHLDKMLNWLSQTSTERGLRGVLAEGILKIAINTPVELNSSKIALQSRSISEAIKNLSWRELERFNFMPKLRAILQELEGNSTLKKQFLEQLLPSLFRFYHDNDEIRNLIQTYWQENRQDQPPNFNNSRIDTPWRVYLERCLVPKLDQCKKRYPVPAVDARTDMTDMSDVNQASRMQSDYNLCRSTAHRECLEEAQSKVRERNSQQAEQFVESKNRFKGMSPNNIQDLFSTLALMEREKLQEEARAAQAQSDLTEINRMIEGAVEGEEEAADLKVYVNQSVDRVERELLTLGLCNIDFSQGIGQVAFDVIHHFAENILQSVSMLCEELGVISDDRIQHLKSLITYLEGYGLAPHQIGEGKAVALDVQGSLGLRISQGLEMVIHGHGSHACLGFFCRAGASIGAQGGIAGELELGQSLQCPNNKAYAGSFLTLGAHIGLGGGFGVSYGMGVDIPGMMGHFHQIVKDAWNSDGQEFKDHLSEDMHHAEEILHDSHTSPQNKFALWVVCNTIGKLFLEPESFAWLDDQLDSQADLIHDALTIHMSTPSAGGLLKDAIAHFAHDERLPPAFREILSGFEKFLTGCDSIGVGISIGPHAEGGPTVGLTEFVLAGEVPLTDLQYTATMLGPNVSPANFAANLCKEGLEGIEKIKNTVMRLIEIQSNIASCSLAARYQQLAYLPIPGNPFFSVFRPHAIEEYNFYNNNYAETHPQHASDCSCGEHEGPNCGGGHEGSGHH